MSVMASQIISLTIVYWIVYSGADQRKHQSSASLAFMRGIHRWPVNPPHKGPVTRSMFPFDDVVMIQHTDVSWTSWELILDFGHRLLIFLILATFRLCESGKFAISGHFLENTMGNGLKFGMLVYSGHPQNRLDFDHGMLIFRTHGTNGLKFDLLMYPDHLWNWLHSGHGQLIFLILAPFLLSETGEMQFPGIFVTMYGRNWLKLVISILWYPQKRKRQILAHENYPVAERELSLTTM